MPGRNIDKTYLEDSFYHVYGRGHSKGVIYRDDEDYAVFLNLFKRYLSNEPVRDKKGREYPWLSNDIELLAFCLMPNHFHALIYQHKPHAITDLFKPLVTTYAMYFNKKYKLKGPVFQSRFKASLVTSDEYLLHISRYLHLNPKNYRAWPFSSLPYYLGRKTSEWCDPSRILSLFDNVKDYERFVGDYEDHKKMLDEIKSELANH